MTFVRNSHGDDMSGNCRLYLVSTVKLSDFVEFYVKTSSQNLKSLGESGNHRETNVLWREESEVGGKEKSAVRKLCKESEGGDGRHSQSVGQIHHQQECEAEPLLGARDSDKTDQKTVSDTDALDINDMGRGQCSKFTSQRGRKAKVTGGWI